jgi:predicted regulator of Ras-like GTPase activity (Roadblock/LC7/MglB family)
MAETKTERLEEQLRKLENVGGVEGAAIVARNGLMIASRLPKDIDERRFCAMAATMMGAVETAAATLKRGAIKRVTAEIEKATIVTMGAGSKALLVVAARFDANLGMLMIEMEEYADRIRSIMEESA